MYVCVHNVYTYTDMCINVYKYVLSSWCIYTRTMHRCKVFNASSSFLFLEVTISIAGYLRLTGFSALQVAAGGLVGRQGLDLLLLRRPGTRDWLGLPL